MKNEQFIRGLLGLESRRRRFLSSDDSVTCDTSDEQGCVATIGSFDGVHLGHRRLLDKVIEKAEQMKLPAMVILFEPQPYEFFSRERAPARLMRLREKVCALYDAQIDSVLCLKFNSQLRKLSAQDYIERVLVDGIRVRHLVVGDDFRFGCDRSGDFALLQKAGKKYGFSVCDTKTLRAHDKRISSTRIRQLLEKDDLKQAAQLLGRPFSVSGRVIYGKQLGRTIGFPTVNIGLGRYRSPVSGVYCVTVTHGGTAFQGVANVGVRPTVGGIEKPLLEVHLFDVQCTLYGKFLHVTFLQKIREEKVFASLDELKKQIATDVSYARGFFNGPVS